jgi:peptidoglycan/LPS O-acetylase OafA/YrhL
MRKDIQALRAVAVVAVVVFHFWPSVLPGGFIGVDVFFVISGYLITSHLMRNPPRRVRDFAAFWARRLLRLLPPVIFVVLVVLALAVAFMSSGRWADMAHQAVTSTFYVQNWQLIATATDYLNAHGAPSPFQHFWSLSVEEQYYIIWPFVIVALSWISTRWVRARASRTYAAGFSLVVAVSLTISIILTTRNPAEAYFSTYSRMWELGIGSLLASLAPAASARLHRHVTVRAGILTAGLLGIVLSVFLINDQTPFPGVAALAPTVAAALVILANDPDHPLNPRAFLSSRPVQFLGDTSYALYLWHWPLITLAAVYLGHPLGVRSALPVLAASIFMAWLSTRWLEAPIRGSVVLRNRPLRIFAVGAVSSSVVLVAAFGLTSVVARDQERSRIFVAEQASLFAQCFGAPASDLRHSCKPQPLATSPGFAKTDVSRGVLTDCLAWPPYPQPVHCTTNPTAAPTRRIALLGNSHAGHWLPALEILAKKYGWQVDTYIVGVCVPTRAPSPFGTGMAGLTKVELTDKCQQVMSQTLDTVARGRYDTVVMSVMDRDHRVTVSDYEATLRSLVKAHEKVLVIRDTPAPMDQNNLPPDCVAHNTANVDACSGDPARWIGADPLAEASKQLRSPRVRLVDVNKYLCAKTCPAVIGGVIVYSDYDHLTATIVKTLTRYIEPSLVSLLAS